MDGSVAEFGGGVVSYPQMRADDMPLKRTQSSFKRI